MMVRNTRIFERIGNQLSVFVIIIFTFSGCAHLMPPPVTQPSASNMIRHLAEANPGLNQLKGIGQIHLQTSGYRFSGRIALAVQLPDRLRIDWLAPLGQSSPLLIADGQTITLFTGHSDEGRHYKQRKRALHSILHIPVDLDFLTALLVGRLMLPPYTAVQFRDQTEDMAEMVLLNRWSKILAECMIDQMNQRIASYAQFGADGNVQYRITWQNWQDDEGYWLPRQIEIRTEQGTWLQLRFLRFFCNSSMPEDLFTAPSFR